MKTHAIFVEDSQNAKISQPGAGKVSATYASIRDSCPTGCALRKTRECYAMQGHVALQTRRLEYGRGTSVLQVAREEARAIDRAFGSGPVPQDGAAGGRDLRLHVSGDCRTNQAARIVSAAAGRLQQRGGGRVWSYTHAFHKVRRASWADVSVLASVDDLSEVRLARRQGYAPARYVGDFPNGPLAWQEAGVRWIPCPAQTKDRSCVECRLCFDDRALYRRRAGIAFAAHGNKSVSMKRRLTIVKPQQGA